MKAKVDQDLCAACGLCIELCPEVFEEAESGTARAKVDTVPPDAEDSCKDAADQCPVECIAIEE